MTGFPEDIAAIIEAQPVEPSAEVQEARAKRLTVEDVERLRQETEAELNPDDLPAEPPKPMDIVEAFDRGML